MTEDRPQSIAWLTREDMIRRGAYGYIDRACECDIPLRDVILLVPQPACAAWGEYTHAGKDQPVEVRYSRADNGYLVFAGTRRVQDAMARGKQYLRAFVEADAGEVGPFAIPKGRDEKVPT